MTDLYRDAFLRYLHERGEMSLGERMQVEWQLLTSTARRQEYNEMERMHHALSFHFAPSVRVVIPAPGSAWFCVGIAGLMGAIAVAGSLSWMHEYQRPAHLQKVIPSIQTHCAYCNRITKQCTHCFPSAAPATTSCSRH